MTAADPRGPYRTALKVEATSKGTFVTLNCGHVSDFNQIFHYEVGSEYRCFECGQIERRKATPYYAWPDGRGGHTMEPGDIGGQIYKLRD